MVEHVRAHRRVPQTEVQGERHALSLGTILIAKGAEQGRATPLLVHFHGASWMPEHAAVRRWHKAAVLAVHIGAGSGIYTQAFADPSRFGRLLDELPLHCRPVVLSGFSAGCAAESEGDGFVRMFRLPPRVVRLSSDFESLYARPHLKPFAKRRFQPSRSWVFVYSLFIRTVLWPAIFDASMLDPPASCRHVVCARLRASSRRRT
jgi:hypothetical protein